MKNDNIIRLKPMLLFTLLLTLLSLGNIARADVDQGLVWLSQQNETMGLATHFQQLAETLNVVNSSADNAALKDRVVTALTQIDSTKTEYLARRVIAGVVSNQDVTPFLSMLITRQNKDGGFGDEGLGSTTLNTAYVLQSIAKTNVQNAEVVGRGMRYLLDHQQSDGGYHSGAGFSRSSLYVTATVMRALSDYQIEFNVTTALERAHEFLATHTPGEDFETALTLLAALPHTTDLARFNNHIKTLQNNQHSEGHWNQDPYTTALAIQALRLVASLPDLAALQGHIVDAEQKTELIGTRIHVSSGSTVRNQVSNVAGNFGFRNLPAQDYTLAITHEGYQTQTTRISLQRAQTLDLGTIQLLKIATDESLGQAVILGNVTGPNGEKLSNVRIALGNGQSAQTDASGNYRIDHVAPGSLSIVISKQGFNSVFENTVVRANETLRYTIQLSVGHKTLIGLSGQVLDKTTQQAPDNISLVLTGVNTLTQTIASGGAYQIDQNLNPGTTTLTVSADGYHTIRVDIILEGANAYIFSPLLIPISDSPTPPDPEVPTPDPDNTAGFSGQTLDANTQQPISNATIQLSNGQTTRTDSSGRFTVKGLNAGQISVTISQQDYQSRVAALTLQSSLMLDLGEVLLASTKPAFGFTVNLVDSSSNQALQGVNMTITNQIDDQNISLLSDSDGVIRTSQLTQAFNTLNISSPGYLGISLDVFLTEANNALGQLRLRRASADDLLPDLIISQMNTDAIEHHPDSLELSGKLTVTMTNLGRKDLPQAVRIVAYEDRNHNAVFEHATDQLIGDAFSQAILAGEEQHIEIPVQGVLAFRHAPISVWIDSNEQVTEPNEENNLSDTGQWCRRATLDHVGAFKPVLKWHWSGEGINEVYTTPIVGQLTDDNNDGQINNDDIPDVLVVSHKGNFFANGVLIALNGDDGSEVWANDGSARIALATYSPALADIDGDGIVEIIVSHGNVSTAGVVVYEHDGTEKWRVQGGKPGNIAITDLEGDGQIEIIAGGTVLNADGQVLFHTVVDPSALAVDLDLDGRQEIFAGGKAYDAEGHLIWSTGHPIGRFGSFAAVGNFDEDDNPEIAFISNNKVTVVEHTGELKWQVLIPGNGGGSITLADVDGDNEIEVGVAGASYYVVFEADGSIKWTQRTQDQSSAFTGSSVFDFDGDSNAEIVYADEQFLRVFDGKTGEVLLLEPNSSGTIAEYPTIVDVDNDGHAEIVVVCTNQFIRSVRLPDGTIIPGTNGVRVFENETDDWMPTRKIWNQHAYSISNINDDGSIPTDLKASWLSHNTYRLNTFLDRNPLLLPDLSTALFKAQTDGKQQTLTLRVGNGSGLPTTETEVTFHLGDANGQLLGRRPIPALKPGEHLDLSLENLTGIDNGTELTAVIPVQERGECRVSNNQITTLAIVINTVRASITTDKQNYNSTDRVQLTSRVRNTAGNATQTSSVSTITVSNPQGTTLFTHQRTNAPLLPNQLQDANVDLTLVQAVSGDYQVTLVLTDSLTGRILDTTETSFSVTPDAFGGVSGHIQVNHTQVFQGEPIQCDISVTHNGEIALSENSLRYLLVDLARNEPLLVTAFTPQPGPGTTQSLAEAIDSTALNGGYACVLQININDTWENMAAVGFGIALRPVQQLKGSLDISASEVQRGDPLTCTRTLHLDARRGTLTGANIVHRVIALSTGETVQEDIDSITLNAGEQRANVLQINTNQLSAGGYQCTLSAEQNGLSVDLGAVDFVLVQPLIRINSSITLAPIRGRILILMEKKSDEGESNNAHSGRQAQRAFLESVLIETGWQYTIVTDKHRFIDKLRQGGYTAYALMPKHSHIPSPLQRELREATFRGEGFMLMAEHNLVCNYAISEALGIDFHGGRALATWVDVIQSPLADAQQILLEADLPLAQSAGATIAASTDDTIVVAYQHYGKGKAVYLGYNLLAEGVLDQDAFHRTLLSQALDYLQSGSRGQHVGDTFGVSLQLGNQGIAVDGRAQLTWPQDIRLVAASETLKNTDEMATWLYDLSENEQQYLDLWLSASSIGLFALTVDLEVNNNGVLEQHQQVEIEVQIEGISGIDEVNLDSVIGRLEELESDENCLKKAKVCYADVLKSVLQAEKAWLKNNPKQALNKLLRVTDDLISLQGEAAVSTRYLIDQLIRQVSQQIESKH